MSMARFLVALSCLAVCSISARSADLGKIDRLRRSALHLECQLVTGDARLQGGIPPPFGGMLVVVSAERVEQVALRADGSLRLLD